MGALNSGDLQRREHFREAVPALEAFVNQATTRSPSPTLKRNIEDGVVGLVIPSTYADHMRITRGNGLLITDDGYFLTSLHCLEEDLRSAYIQNGAKYPIERVCMLAEKQDLALVKAKLPGPCTPRAYAASPVDAMRRQAPVALLTRTDGQLRTKAGFFKHPNVQAHPYTDASHRERKEVRDQFETSIPAVQGDSGGSIVTIEGAWLGITATGGEFGHPIYDMTATRLDAILRMVQFYASKRRQEYHL